MEADDDTLYGPNLVDAPVLEGYINCTGVTDGRPLTVFMQYRTIVPQLSPLSNPVTMLCAGFPDPPDEPLLVLGTRDEIAVSWSLPTYDGGSPVLGFFIYMKAQDDDDYVLVQDGGEDPTLLYFSIRTDHFGDLIVPRTYLIMVNARNWVGTGSDSVPLEIVIPYRSSPDLTDISGDGILTIQAAVTAQVTI